MNLIFFEKPGCGGNARQRAWLEAAGHHLEVHDLLRWPWSREALLAFLAPLPVAEWFNRAAPAVRDGVIVPEELDVFSALPLLLAQPLLIRRPLIELPDGRRFVGFDETRLREALAELPARAAPAEGCPRRARELPES